MSGPSNDSAAPSTKARVWSLLDASRAKEQQQQSLNTFLEQNRPSAVKPIDPFDAWVWVLRDDPPLPAPKVQEDAIERGAAELDALQKRLTQIQEDGAIPVRKSKTGGPTKSMLKAEQAKATQERLKEIATESGWRIGKWLFFEGPERVDFVFGTLARSIIDGPLSKLATPPFAIKAALQPREGERRDGSPESVRHCICLYLADVWTPDSARQVLEVLLEHHGLKPSAAKSDLFTYIGLSSKHPSGIRSSQWQPQELIDRDTIDKLLNRGRRARQRATAEEEEDFEDGNSVYSAPENTPPPVEHKHSTTSKGPAHKAESEKKPLAPARSGPKAEDKSSDTEVESPPRKRRASPAPGNAQPRPSKKRDRFGRGDF